MYYPSINQRRIFKVRLKETNWTHESPNQDSHGPDEEGTNLESEARADGLRDNLGKDDDEDGGDLHEREGGASVCLLTLEETMGKVLTTTAWTPPPSTPSAMTGNVSFTVQPNQSVTCYTCISPWKEKDSPIILARSSVISNKCPSFLNGMTLFAYRCCFGVPVFARTCN